MSERASAAVIEETLRLSRSPAAELAAAALQAQSDAKLPAADFIVVAVPAGTAGETKELVDRALS